MRTTSWALLSLAAILALGGCGSDNDDSGAQTSSVSSQQTSSTAAVSSAAAQSSEAAVSSAVSSTSPFPDTGDSSSAISSMDSSVISSASSIVAVSSEAVSSEAESSESSAAFSSVSIFPGDGSSSSATAQSSSVADTVDPDQIVTTNPIPYTCEDTTANFPFPTSTELVVKSGTEGDILYDCEFLSETQGFQLQNGVASITAVQIIRDDTFYGTVDGRTWQGLTHYDYNAGTIRYTGSASDLGTLDCTETYQSQMPVTFLADDIDYIYDVFYWEGIDKTDPEFISTTCPDWFYEEDGGDTTGAQSYNMEYINNYVVTDDEGGTHTVSIYGHANN